MAETVTDPVVSPLSVAREIHPGTGAGGVVMRARFPRDSVKLAPYAGQAQVVYIAPPFCTGQAFQYRLPIGEEGFRTGKPIRVLEAYADRYPDADAYMEEMRALFALGRDLLREDGALFAHIDWRMHGRMRVMLDELFGASNFMNEIVWAYQTGGRAQGWFSRKHDTILFYRKSEKLYFDLKASPIAAAPNRNHMKRDVDEQGRPYRSIRSGGKEYRYYDDDPQYPTDVWTDIAPLQQRDPRRTGYDGQKPRALLDRMVLCASRPGDLVADLAAGSGTTAESAAALGRRFLACDASPSAVNVTRKRLLGSAFVLDAGENAACGVRNPGSDGCCVAASVEASSEGGLTARLVSYETKDAGEWPPDALGHVDQWYAGWWRDGVFTVRSNAARSKAEPALPDCLPLGNGELGAIPAVMTVDICGARRAFALGVQAAAGRGKAEPAPAAGAPHAEQISMFVSS